jgi:surface antigen
MVHCKLEIKIKRGINMKLIATSAKSDAKKVVVGELKAALLLIAAGSLAGSSSQTAEAQMINPFGKYNGPTLGKEDYKLADEAVGALLNEKTPTVGAYNTWSNSASGNRGKFTVLEIFTSNGMPCRKVNESISYHKAGPAPRSFTLDLCKLPSGEWKTVA